MAIPASELTRFVLPIRIRTRKAPEDGLATRLVLAGRIAALPGVETVEDGIATLPCSVDVYLRAPGGTFRRRQPAVRLCSICRDAISVNGLSDRDRHLVLSRGWGRLEEDRVLLYLPRNDEELEVCWEILQRAYRALIDASAAAAPVRTLRPTELPRFSRTTLQ